jgi:hypothetical protein
MADIRTIGLVWTQQRLSQVKTLWSQKEPQLSVSQIAKIMNASKNSISGAVHRLGCESRESPIRRTVRIHPKQPSLLMRSHELSKILPAITHNMAKIIDHTNAEPCCWVIECGPPPKYCDQPSVPRKSMCIQHRAIAVKPYVNI